MHWVVPRRSHRFFFRCICRRSVYCCIYIHIAFIRRFFFLLHLYFYLPSISFLLSFLISSLRYIAFAYHGSEHWAELRREHLQTTHPRSTERIIQHIYHY
ncbi:hypothetical protein B0J11DRAFT_182211 [Dendryphion nanum]|uniref:Uncharacterized protein n=1 Tax=Dendryphion nanum TaxID=256645 RepID=A0A9P9D5M5_9PLEO|nr:hypothetical protein B0J11DRAFT_182211 [Dendryphion nanum]